MATGVASASAASSLDTILGTSANRYVQLHPADPGAAGTTSIAANTTRAVVQFAAASGGAKSSNADASWTSVSTTETYSHFSIWSAASSGTFYFSGTISGGGVTAGQDFKISSGSLTVNITPAS